MTKQVEYAGMKKCIIDSEGGVLIEPKIDVDRLSRPRFGRCLVEKDGKFGYIDLSGDLVIPFQYEEAHPYSENGLAFVVEDSGLGGYIDREGDYVLDPVYESGSGFKFGFAAVSKNGEYKYIYSNGSQAIGESFLYASAFSDTGLATVMTEDGSYHLMDTMSRIVLTMKQGAVIEPFADGNRVSKFRSEGEGEALIDAAGNRVTGFYEEIIIVPYANRHPFRRRGLWGYLDNNGREVIPSIYKRVSPFYDEKMAKVTSFHPLAKQEELSYYINRGGEIVADPFTESFRERFVSISRFHQGLAVAVKEEKWEESEESDQPANEDQLEELGVEEDRSDKFHLRALWERLDAKGEASIALYEVELTRIKGTKDSIDGNMNDIERALNQAESLYQYIWDEFIFSVEVTVLRPDYIRFVFLANPEIDEDFIISNLDEICEGYGRYSCKRHEVV